MCAPGGGSRARPQAPGELARVIALWECELAACRARLPPALAAQYDARGAEAVWEGGDVDAAARGCPQGRWEFPAVIADEAAFRAQVRAEEARERGETAAGGRDSSDRPRIGLPAGSGVGPLPAAAGLEG